jgi:hypothetical protein
MNKRDVKQTYRFSACQRWKAFFRQGSPFFRQGAAFFKQGAAFLKQGPAFFE